MNEDYLLKNGWVRDKTDPPYNLWLNAELKIIKWGITFEKAVREQQKLEVLKDGRWFYSVKKLRFGQFDYGFVIAGEFGLGEKKKFANCFFTFEKWEEADRYLSQLAPDIKPQKLKLLELIYPEYPYLLRFEEKHGEYHYHVPTISDYLKVCLSTVLRRNCYLQPDSKGLKTPQFTELEIKSWEDGELKRAALKEWENYGYRRKNYNEEYADYTLFEIANNAEEDEEKRCLAAAKLLAKRSKYGYERVEWIILDEI